MRPNNQDIERDDVNLYGNGQQDDKCQVDPCASAEADAAEGKGSQGSADQGKEDRPGGNEKTVQGKFRNVCFVPSKLVVAEIEIGWQSNWVGQKCGFGLQRAEDHQNKRIEDDYG